jgi:hypothetical protein
MDNLVKKRHRQGRERSYNCNAIICRRKEVVKNTKKINNLIEQCIILIKIKIKKLT